MKNPRPRAVDRKPGRRGFDCGLCGKPVKPYHCSLKCDGWHWHQKCWRDFLIGKWH